MNKKIHVVLASVGFLASLLGAAEAKVAKLNLIGTPATFADITVGVTIYALSQKMATK